MKKLYFLLTCLVLLSSMGFSQGYKVGDRATDFKLKNIDGKYVSMSDYPYAKGFVVIFTCNHCPYAQAYQDRMIQLDKKYKALYYPLLAISSSDPAIVPDDSYELMVKKAKEQAYTFPYLFDENQSVMHQFGAQRTPHVFLLEKKGNELIVQYIGAIDDNYQEPEKVTSPYLSNAIDALLAGKTPNPTFTKAIGCGIKDSRIKSQ
jgi:peroxiredoxin